ncbi:MAG TPA: hypothetical protein VN604_08670, partial [Nitrospirota bacterium]|nr:hypothetical protein [Nitrospirota bacterium]
MRYQAVEKVFFTVFASEAKQSRIETQQYVRDCRPCFSHAGAGSAKNAPRNDTSTQQDALRLFHVRFHDIGDA